jgi:hypothetical protein
MRKIFGVAVREERRKRQQAVYLISLL